VPRPLIGLRGPKGKSWNKLYPFGISFLACLRNVNFPCWHIFPDLEMRHSAAKEKRLPKAVKGLKFAGPSKMNFANLSVSQIFGAVLSKCWLPHTKSVYGHYPCVIPSVKRGGLALLLFGGPFPLFLLCVPLVIFCCFWSRHRLAMCCHGIFHFTAAQHTKHTGHGAEKPHKLTRLNTPWKSVKVLTARVVNKQNPFVIWFFC